jgi:hypothetical protein
MSWLKKVGQVAAKCIGIWQVIAPLAAKVIPGAGEIGGIVNVLVSVEQIFVSAFGADAKKGSDKLRAATPQVAQLIQSSAVFQGKAIKDEKLAEGGFTKITEGFADVLNAYGE